MPWTNSLQQWLRFDLAQTAVKDRTLYPQFSPELAIAMTEETKRLVSDLVWNDRSFTDLFTARYTYVNSDLASLYGIPAPATDFDRVPLPDTAGRAGILGHGALPRANKQAWRNFTYGPRVLRSRALLLPPGAGSTPRDKQQLAATHSGPSANEPRPAQRALDQPDVRGLS